MNGFLKKFTLGDVTLSNNIFYAPLAGCSDLPFRRMVNKYRPGLFFCEMVKMDALIRHDPKTYRILDYSSSMHPIGAQICGSKLEITRQSSKIIEDLGFDVLDLNCGCPVDKVTKDGSGSGMLKNPELIGEIISEMVSAVSIPVTLKIRAGWDEDSINAVEITKIAEKAGAKAISIHGRTRQQAYKGKANWEHIKDAKIAAANIKVIGNGDVFSVENAEKMFSYTGCDAVLISRGSLGQPWFIEDFMAKSMGKMIERSAYDVKKSLLEHFAFILEYQNEKKALLDMRRVGCWYLKRCQGAKELRRLLNKAKLTQDAICIIEDFDWDSLELITDASE